jgi:YidC/Oxa1 family membrane protein insertase
MDRRTLVAITLCFLIFLGWQKFYIEPRLPKAAPQQEVAVTADAKPAESVAGAATPKKPGKPTAPGKTDIAPETREVQLGAATVQVSNGSRIFTGWDLKTYRLGIAKETEAVSMKTVTHQDAEVELAFDDPDLAYITTVRGVFSEIPNGWAWTYEDDRIRIVRETTGGDKQAHVDLNLEVEFKGAQSPKNAFVSLTHQSSEDDAEAQDKNLLYGSNKDVTRTHMSDSIELQDVPAPVRWVGATSRYFLMALVNEGGLASKALVQPLAPYSGRVSLVYPIAGNSLAIPLRAYFGPMEIDTLRLVDPSLESTIDFGWFTVFAYPLLRLMKWFHEVAGNWGIAIILLTILVKIVTFPLTWKSMKSMKQKLRDKHKDDKEALNREMLTLMRGGGYNPVAGCLPILIQMPVFFALYKVLYSSIELYHAPFALWIQDLSARDPYYVTPVLLTATMYIQQKMTPNTAADPAQARMMQMMPVIFGVFMLTLPSGLTLYMLVNAITSIIQQAYLNKKFANT